MPVSYNASFSKCTCASERRLFVRICPSRQRSGSVCENRNVRLISTIVHAKETEKFLVKKKTFTNEVLQKVLKILEGELTEIAGEMIAAYRKKCSLGHFYKDLLVLISQFQLKPIYRSRKRDFRKTKPVSKGSQGFDTNPIIYPVNEPMPKNEVLIQCAGEIKYVNDLVTQPREVFCVFVTSDICTGELESIDPSAALKIPGIVASFSAKDISGTIVDYHVIMTVYQGDGTVDVKTAAIEIGQAVNTIVAQVVAYTLNISVDKVRVKLPDAFSTANSFSVAGTRSTKAACFAAIKCCQLLLDRLAVVRETLTDPTWEVLIRTAYQRGINLHERTEHLHTYTYRTTNNDHIFYRVAGAVVTEVELDILTGEHEVLRVDIVEDVGTGVNPKLDVGQSMGLPQLETCCFIFDLKTGNIIMGAINALSSFTLIIVFAVIANDVEWTGDVDYDALATGLYVMCILLTILFLIRLLFDIYFIYGVIKENASIIKTYFIEWVIVFFMSTSLFLLKIDSFNAGTIITECLHMVPNVYTILLSQSYYKQLNSREEV